MDFCFAENGFRLSEREAVKLSSADSRFDRHTLSYPITDAEVLLGAARQAYEIVLTEVTHAVRNGKLTSIMSDDVIMLRSMQQQLDTTARLLEEAQFIGDEAAAFLRS